ncbi:MAG: hypothetical protein M9899_03615 [Bdellovibrionaceae bacterium]|nr:hypothetical protein [Pseudobdellovibrionaceae bacterium]
MKQPERSKRLFQLFIVTFFIVMAVSGGTQLFLSPQRVAGWIKTGIPDYEHLDIEFKKAQVSFSGSFFPLFGIKAKGVMIRYHGCSNSFQMNAPYILVPFSLIEAFRGKLRFGYLKIGDVDLQVLKKDNICIEQEQQSASEPVEPTHNVTQALEGKDYDQLFTALLKPFRGVKGLKIQKVNVYEPVTALWDDPKVALSEAKEKVKQLEADKETEASELLAAQEDLAQIQNAKHAEVQRLRLTYDKSNESILLLGGIKILLPRFETLKRLPVYWINLEFNKAKGLKMNAKARYNEGRFSLNSDYQKDLDDLKLHWKASDFPFSFLVKTFDTKQTLSQLNTHLLWLNGEGALLASYHKKLSLNVLARVLRLRGEMVDAIAGDVEIAVYPKLDVQKPFEWRIEKLDLEQASDFLDHKGLRGVLRRAGHIRGSGIVNGFQDIVFEGSVEGLEFFFSSSGQRAFQKVEKAEMSLEYYKDKFRIDLERITFGEGEVEGQIGFELKPIKSDEYQWKFQANGQSLKFNNQVYALFMLEPFSFDKFDITVQGQEKYANHILVNAKIEECKTLWGEFEGMNLQIKAQDHKKMFLQMQSKKFEVNSKYVQTADLIPNHLENAVVKMDLLLDQDLGSLEFIAQAPKVGPLKLTAKEIPYKTKSLSFNGHLTRAGKSYEVHGDLEGGYKFKLAE